MEESGTPINTLNRLKWIFSVIKVFNLLEKSVCVSAAKSKAKKTVL